MCVRMLAIVAVVLLGSAGAQAESTLGWLGSLRLFEEAKSHIGERSLVRAAWLDPRLREELHRELREGDAEVGDLACRVLAMNSAPADLPAIRDYLERVRPASVGAARSAARQAAYWGRVSEESLDSIETAEDTAALAAAVETAWGECLGHGTDGEGAGAEAIELIETYLRDSAQHESAASYCDGDITNLTLVLGGMGELWRHEDARESAELFLRVIERCDLTHEIDRKLAHGAMWGLRWIIGPYPLSQWSENGEWCDSERIARQEVEEFERWWAEHGQRERWEWLDLTLRAAPGGGSVVLADGSLSRIALFECVMSEDEWIVWATACLVNEFPGWTGPAMLWLTPEDRRKSRDGWIDEAEALALLRGRNGEIAMRHGTPDSSSR